MRVRWKPGDIISLTRDIVRVGNNRENLPLWDRPWHEPDITIGGHVHVGNVPFGTQLLVLQVSPPRVWSASARVLTSTGIIAYVHADEVMMGDHTVDLSTV